MSRSFVKMLSHLWSVSEFLDLFSFKDLEQLGAITVVSKCLRKFMILE